MKEFATVLYVQHYSDGGSVMSLLELVRGLDRDRFRPIVCFRERSSFISEFEAAGIPVVVLFDSVEPSSPGALRRRAPVGPSGVAASSALRRVVRRAVRRDLPAAKRLVRIVREHGVDLIHANNEVASNHDALIAGVLTRRPVVQHVRGMYRYNRGLELHIDRALARSVDRFIFVSSAVAECHRKQLPAKAGRFTVVDNPFDIERYQANSSSAGAHALDPPQDARVILNVGRIVRWKGQDVFVRALARVMATDDTVVGLLVGAPTGDDGEAFRRELEELVAGFGIADRVILAGAQTDVAGLLDKAYMVVHSAVAPEPFGRVVVEAMAAGRPVIGAGAGGVIEIIDPGVTGIVVPPNDPERLATAMRELLDDPIRAASMGARAQRAVAKRFSIRAHVEAVQHIYQLLLSD